MTMIPQAPSRRWLEFLLVSVVFLACYFAARHPLFKLGWDGTDANGHDTDIVVHRPTKPNYLLLARIEGHNVYQPPIGHPGPMYSMFSNLGVLLGKLVTFDRLSDTSIIHRLKRLTAVVQLVIWWALLAMACFSQNLRQRPVNRILAYAGLLALAASPMALNCSNEFQLDSFFGFVMAGSVVLALAVWDKGCLHPRASRALFFLASAFLGLGKNEWSLVLLVALILLLLYACIPCLAGDAIWRRQAWACVGWSLLGLLAGNLVNWLFEPQLYMSGWNLLYYMVGHASLAKSACAVRFGQLTLDRLPFIQVHVALLLYLAWRFLAVKPAPSPTCLLAGAFGAGLFLAFFFSTWDSIPRYFAPAFIALSATALWAHATWPRNATQPAVLITMCVFAWWGYSGYAFAHSENLRNQCVYGVHSVTVPKTVDNIPLLRVEDAYRRPELDFVHSSCGIEEARRLIRDYGSHKHPFVP